MINLHTRTLTYTYMYVRIYIYIPPIFSWEDLYLKMLISIDNLFVLFIFAEFTLQAIIESRNTESPYSQYQSI